MLANLSSNTSICIYLFQELQYMVLVVLQMRLDIPEAEGHRWNSPDRSGGVHTHFHHETFGYGPEATELLQLDPPASDSNIIVLLSS